MDKRRELLNVLQQIKENQWESAHNIAQQHEGELHFDRIHALLHRIEGDRWNAEYWYRRVGEKYPSISIEQEIEKLILEFS